MNDEPLKIDDAIASRLLWTLYSDLTCPNERDCWLAVEDELFFIYWACLGHEDMLSEKDRVVVEQHIRGCRWCQMERDERTRVMAGEPVINIGKKHVHSLPVDYAITVERPTEKLVSDTKSLVPNLESADLGGLVWRPGDEDTYSVDVTSGVLFGKPVNQSARRRLGATMAETAAWEVMLPLPAMESVPSGLACYLKLRQEGEQYWLEASLGDIGTNLREDAVDVTIIRRSTTDKVKDTLQIQLTVGESPRRQLLSEYGKKENWMLQVCPTQEGFAIGF